MVFRISVMKVRMVLVEIFEVVVFVVLVVFCWV